MKSKLLVFLLLLVYFAGAQNYQPALPGYEYHFPRDHFNHPEYQTEWWYYTGNLKAADGRRFGFELTFFRQGLDRSARTADNKDWGVRDLYLAHLALSDIDGQKFFHTERFNRAGPGIAGVAEQTGMIWNGNWQVQLTPDEQRLQAVADDLQLKLTMRSKKPPVIHGQNGVSQKAMSGGKGEASHYISFTRLLTKGAIEWHGKTYQVEGDSWMDHEFFTASANSNLSGWDWLSIQLEDNTELMLYRLRDRDGAAAPYSSGTFVDADGTTRFLSHYDFIMEPAGTVWTSPQTHAAYPVSWHVSVPGLGLDLNITTPLQPQELAAQSSARIAPSYWEGAVDIAGRRSGAAIRGSGYLEMTGYDKAVKLGR